MKSPDRRMRIASSLLALIVLAGPSWAKDFPQRAESDLKSRREGLGRAEAPILERTPGKGVEAVAAALIQRFEKSSAAITTRGGSRKESQAGPVRFAAQDWSLEVFGDGTRVRYRNTARLGAAGARPVAERLSNDKLEELGRRFIAEDLRGLIQVGSNERIVPLYTEFEIAGGGPTQEGARPEADVVVANTIVFTRTIDDLPVVGGGSKIAVTFANDGTAVAFDFDWPEYRPTGRRQKVLPVDAIRERGNKVLAVALTAPDVKVTRFECGLFDPGLRRRDARAPVQSACFVQTVRRPIVDPEAHAKDFGSGHVVEATAQALPAGDPILPDAKWPEAMRLLGSNPKPEPTPPAGPTPR